MFYKSYGNKQSTPSRLARKHMRKEVFLANAKMAKKARKARRLERKALQMENEVSHD